MMRSLTLFSLLLAVCLVACRPDEACIGGGSSGLGLKFVAINDTLATPPTDTVLIQNIYTANASNQRLYLFPLSTADTAIINSNGFKDLFRLGLNPDQDSTIFVFESLRRTDSLIVKYNRRYQLLSPDCPITVNYTQLEVADHTFTDVEINRTDLTEFSATPDLYLYF